MTNPKNPYSPGRPVEEDDQFFDREQMLEQIKRCLVRSKSCSVIGGAGMGKSSLLRRVRRMTNEIPISASQVNYGATLLCVYFKPDLKHTATLRSIYRQLIEDTVREAGDWLWQSSALSPKELTKMLQILQACRISKAYHPTTSDEDWVVFENAMWHVIQALLPAAPYLRIVFLLDDVYRIENDDVKQTFVRNWFDFLDEENSSYELLRPYLTIVIACLMDHVEQFVLRRPNVTAGPVRNPIEPIYLRVLNQEDVRLLIRWPLEHTLGIVPTDEVVNEIYVLTGGTPWLIQEILSDLWLDIATNSKTLDLACVQGHVNGLVAGAKYVEVRHWIEDVVYQKPVLGPVFQLLAADDRAWKLAALRQELSKQPIGLRRSHQVQDALRTLESLGLVSEEPDLGYRISGALFRIWFNPLTVDPVNFQAYVGKLEGRITRAITFLDCHDHNQELEAIRDRLKQELIELRTTRHLLDRMEATLSWDNPIMRDNLKTLLKEIARIGNDFDLDLARDLRRLDIQLDGV